jgi:hypothetical protein
MAALPPTEVSWVTFKYGLEAAQNPHQGSEVRTGMRKTFPRLSSPLSSHHALRTRKK